MNQTTPPGQDSCQTCVFFRAQDHAGTCHRYPPQFVGETSPNEAHRWKFPWVAIYGWCGEYQRSTRQAPLKHEPPEANNNQ
jgi:hypothetical protein